MYLTGPESGYGNVLAQYSDGVVYCLNNPRNSNYHIWSMYAVSGVPHQLFRLTLTSQNRFPHTSSAPNKF